MPIYISGNYSVYDITEVNNLLNIKADKVPNQNTEDHIASLTTSEGNLKDTGVTVSDLVVDILDGGTF